jgi:hypothetical protein
VFACGGFCGAWSESARRERLPRDDNGDLLNIIDADRMFIVHALTTFRVRRRSQSEVQSPGQHST